MTDDFTPVDQPRTEEEIAEAIMRRRRAFGAVAELPLDYRTHLIIVSPNLDASVQSDGFALWEIAGLLEMCLARVRAMLAQPQQSTRLVDPYDDGPPS